MNLPADLLSIGGLCQHTQRLPDQIRAAIAELDLRPALTINGPQYFTADDARRIVAAFSARDASGLNGRTQIH